MRNWWRRPNGSAPFSTSNAVADGSIHYTDSPADDPVKIDPAGMNEYPGEALQAIVTGNRIQPAAWKLEAARNGLAYLPCQIQGQPSSCSGRDAGAGRRRALQAVEIHRCREHALRDERLAVRSANQRERHENSAMGWCVPIVQGWPTVAMNLRARMRGSSSRAWRVRTRSTGTSLTWVARPATRRLCKGHFSSSVACNTWRRTRGTSRTPSARTR